MSSIARCGLIAGAWGGSGGADVVSRRPPLIRAEAKKQGGFEAGKTAVMFQAFAQRVGIVVGHQENHLVGVAVVRWRDRYECDMPGKTSNTVWADLARVWARSLPGWPESPLIVPGKHSICRKGSDCGGGDGFGDCSVGGAGSGDNVVEREN